MLNEVVTFVPGVVFCSRSIRQFSENVPPVTERRPMDLLQLLCAAWIAAAYSNKYMHFLRFVCLTLWCSVVSTNC